MTDFNPMLDAVDEETIALITRNISEADLRKLASGGYKLQKTAYKTPERKRYTKNDMAYLEFLHKFKYGTAQDLAIITGVKEETAYKRFLQLKRVKLVEMSDKFNYGGVWTLTAKGAALLGDYRWKKRDLPESMLHTRVVNMVAANVIAGNYAVLGSGKGKVLTGATKGLDGVTSEFEIQRSLGYMRGAAKKDEFRTFLRREFKARLNVWDGQEETDPVHAVGEEWMSALIPSFNHLGAYHVPDLVIRRPRKGEFRPQDWAVEVETSVKKERDYRRIMECYASDFTGRDTRVYEAVIWLCRSAKTHNMLTAIAEKKGFLGTRVKVEWVRDAEGDSVGKEFWNL